MESKNLEWIKLLIGFAGSFIGLLLLILFNNLILVTLSQPYKAISAIISYWILALPIIILLLIFKDKLSSIGFRKERIGVQILIGVGLGGLISIFLTLIPHLLGLGEYLCEPRGYTHLWQYAYEFVYCIFAVGAVEELVFRGYLYSRLENIFQKPWISIIVSSVMFGMLHLFSGGIVQAVCTSVLGMMFCLFKLKIKNCTTLTLMITHGVYDALIVVITAVVMGK